MRVERILDGQIVQAEALLHRAQQFLARLMQPDPEEIAADVGRTGFREIDLGAPQPARIGDAIDDRHAGAPLLQACNRTPTPRP